jgi:ubiquinone/menaquinone biosynthesis C-methylase UbiE
MKDNFSTQAAEYAKYRPDYPSQLFHFILSHVKQRSAAWDCATGNGQTAKVLANYFQKVNATDISQKQLDNAIPAPNIIYGMESAEATSFANDVFDLVTVSQALHWLQFEKFYAEVRRVTKNGGWIAAWTYSLPAISPEIDKHLNDGFYKAVIGPYWDAERKYVDAHYSTIPFPFKEIECPVFSIHFNWTLADLRGYINTWSAVQKFIKANNFNPVNEMIEKIGPLWNAGTMNIDFPVHMRMGQVLK